MSEQASKPTTRQDAPKDALTNEQRIANLELQLAQTRAGLPGGTIPDHGAGYGQENEETWSQAEQEAARAEADTPAKPK